MKPFFSMPTLANLVALVMLISGYDQKVFAFGGSYDGAKGSVDATADGQTIPDALINVGIEEHLGAQIPMDAVFLDESGQEVQLGTFFKSGKPILLSFAYYQCPMLCNMVLNGMLNGMKKMVWVAGREYEIVTISMDPNEGPSDAMAKKDTHIKALGMPEAASGWHFLTGTEANIKKVADVVGFKYQYMPVSQEYAHAAGIFTISPQGKISRYLYGVEYRSKDLKLALLDASEGKSISFGDRVAMFCYRYDPNAKGYVLFARNFMKGGGIVTILGIVLLMAFLWRREFKKEAPEAIVALSTKS